MAAAAQPPGRRFDPDGRRTAAPPAAPADAEYAQRAACVAARFSAAAAPIGAHGRVAADPDPAAAANATADADVAIAGAAAAANAAPARHVPALRAPTLGALFAARARM
jgi:hypothetical protein